MTSPVSVLGVLGWCWVGVPKPTHIQPPDFVVLRGCVLGVLGLRTRARANFSNRSNRRGKKSLCDP